MCTIKLKITNHIAYVTLNRPETLNAINYYMLEELSRTVQLLKSSSEARVVIFQGAGEKAFSVGADLKERKSLTEQEVRRNVQKIGEVFLDIENLPQPTIAAINGYAFGGGLELALACDFRFACSQAMLGLTETSLAIIPGAGGTQRLPRIIGETKALELILTAKRMTAFEAEVYGIVLKTIEKERFMEEVESFANNIIKNGPIAVQQAKYAIKAGINTDLLTGLEIERKAYEITIPTEDRQEALQAFAEKRKPNFKGK
ncbi:enoyl-CoA hydratase-related protein [Lederbergia wuyishanensis]|uniref:Enoyl-CoA hydratase/carnithine racemase n=1 Tax=Lederbergia wuyishanensis TaxID=1347903 RepID=A0ABU0CYV2_9BACI|nr:enoyl-CoA hydratase-related protein [Lederbergia wuyishanensis]MCJ8005949.1 enoyl-CoA hydratase-related protein [Lederbergia wuyishanensis]MDQ0341314.1 enoyl-CoA hydratase/carnithine racemase [Lederbergia wuyishanensis]